MVTVFVACDHIRRLLTLKIATDFVLYFELTKRKI